MLSQHVIKAQELGVYEIRDSFNPSLLPGVRFFRMSCLTGYDHNYQFRNTFPKDDIYFARIHSSAFFSVKGDFISAFQFDWKFVKQYNLSHSSDTDIAFNTVPQWVNSVQASAYLKADEEEAARYRFSWNRYQFADRQVNEFSVEVDVLISLDIEPDLYGI